VTRERVVRDVFKKKGVGGNSRSIESSSVKRRRDECEYEEGEL
jgi:hypothetical protein